MATPRPQQFSNTAKVLRATVSRRLRSGEAGFSRAVAQSLEAQVAKTERKAAEDAARFEREAAERGPKKPARLDAPPASTGHEPLLRKLAPLLPTRRRAALTSQMVEALEDRARVLCRRLKSKVDAAALFESDATDLQGVLGELALRAHPEWLAMVASYRNGRLLPADVVETLLDPALRKRFPRWRDAIGVDWESASDLAKDLRAALLAIGRQVQVSHDVRALDLAGGKTQKFVDALVYLRRPGRSGADEIIPLVFGQVKAGENASLTGSVPLLAALARKTPAQWPQLVRDALRASSGQLTIDGRMYPVRPRLPRGAGEGQTVVESVIGLARPASEPETTAVDAPLVGTAIGGKRAGAFTSATGLAPYAIALPFKRTEMRTVARAVLRATCPMYASLR